MGACVVDGVRLHVEQQGDGAPVLCVHGAGGSSALWRAAVARLAGIGRAIAYDRRGYGDSDPVALGARTDVARHADDAAALLGALGAAPAVVIARSYGGEVATDLALRHPDLVRALVLLEAAPVTLVPSAAAWTRALRDAVDAAVERSGVEAVGETLVERALGRGAWSALPEPVRTVFTRNGAGTLADLHGAWLDVDAGALAAIAQPVLLVAARDSAPELREPNEAMARALPDARVAHVEGGHLIDPASDVVLAFVREVVAGAAEPAG